MSICECAWGHCRSCGSDIGWQAERENGKRGGMKAQQGENRKINLEGPCRLVIKPLRPDVYLNKKAICSCCLFLFVFFLFSLNSTNNHTERQKELCQTEMLLSFWDWLLKKCPYSSRIQGSDKPRWTICSSLWILQQALPLVPQLELTSLPRSTMMIDFKVWLQTCPNCSWRKILLSIAIS